MCARARARLLCSAFLPAHGGRGASRSAREGRRRPRGQSHRPPAHSLACADSHRPTTAPPLRAHNSPPPTPLSAPPPPPPHTDTFNKFAASAWGQKLAKREAKASTTDFDRYKAAAAKMKRSSQVGATHRRVGGAGWAVWGGGWAGWGQLQKARRWVLHANALARARASALSSPPPTLLPCHPPPPPPPPHASPQVRKAFNKLKKSAK